MPQVTVTGADMDDAMARLQASIEARCAVAFACDCRLAARLARTEWPWPNKKVRFSYEFVILSPGESAAPGWTIYENRVGRAVGRSA